MKFGLMYEIGMPKPWYEGQEAEKYWQVMAQIEYAEEMGFDYTWAVEHHCLEEFSHCSAPEILFAAASQRTTTMRFGHGAVLLPQPYNYPIRVAERIGALGPGDATWTLISLASVQRKLIRASGGRI